MSHLCDPRVRALAVDAIVLQPLVLGVGAVLLEGAAVLSLAPHAPKERVRLQTQTAASTLGVALVQMDCGGGRKEERGREGGKEIEEGREGGKKVTTEGERVENLIEQPLYK